MIGIDPKKIGIAVITSYPRWYRGKLQSLKHTDKVRGDLALDFARQAYNTGFHIVIADSKSSKTFLRELTAIPLIHLIKRRSSESGKGKRMALDKVSKIPGVEIILLTEPEKISLLTECIRQIAEPLLKDKADIVVPKREEELFRSTYPRYMYESEMEGNKIYHEALSSNNIISQNSTPLDMFFGPKAFKNNKKILTLFKRKYIFSGLSILDKLYDPDNYSSVLFFPIINALKKKLKVANLEVPFRYPRIQKENEDIGARDLFIEKRNAQRMSILIDLMHFLSYLNKKKSSCMKAIK